ncbi:DUF2484 family protein [Paracoccus subflavus]|uniref:DUF2484 family protein n=1 Tax=Paracoccus subflavus TaxID=2528244 RepID=UPI0013EF37C1|nr:DUF2484 family protein [Paracoccus subflavus]
MTADLVITAAIGLGWLALALLQPRLHPRQRARAFWALVGVGIPLLGWLTLTGGPIAGVTGLALGIAMLLRAPRRRDVKRPAPPLD